MKAKGMICGICFLLVLSGGATCQAQDFLQRVEIPSSPNPVGSGARALGMGGAFIAVADDATAASWNPGGLNQMELPEISVVGRFFHRIEDNFFGVSPAAGGDETVSKDGINYLSILYPFMFLQRNMILSLNYQNLYDFTRKWNFTLEGSGLDPMTRYVDYQSEGDLSAIGLAYCIQVVPDLAVGLTVNLWEDGFSDNEWGTRQYERGVGMDAGERVRYESYATDRYAFSGINANIGLLWNVTDSLSIGAVLKTPFEADISHRHTIRTHVQFPDLTGFDTQTANSFSEDATLEMPMSYGIGLAKRFSESFTLALDIFRTEWDDFVYTDAQGEEVSPVTGRKASDADVDATCQLRLGAEYLIVKPEYIVPLRGGLFYDPAPAEGSPDDFYGIAFGTGLAYQRYLFDIAYQYRFGDGVGGSIMQNWGFTQDVREHTVYCSLIVHF